MATSIQSAFSVTFPPAVRAVLAAFELFSLNLFDLGLPLQCMGLGSFLGQLFFMLFAPLVCVVCTVPIAARLLRDEGDVCNTHAVLLRALPLALKILFVIFPLVSAVAVQAFDCELLDNDEEGEAPSGWRRQKKRKKKNEASNGVQVGANGH